jgi:hypothetical protein
MENEKKEEKPKTIFESFLAVQKELQTITKDKKAFKGSYATIENIWESIREIVNRNEFVVMHQSTIKEGLKGLLTSVLHSSGKIVESFIEYSDNKDPQEKGKEITYAKRYNINAIFNVIVADEDNDATKPLGKYQKQTVDGSLAAKKLLNAKNAEDSRRIYASLSAEERKTSEVIKAVEFIKENLT